MKTPNPSIFRHLPPTMARIVEETSDEARTEPPCATCGSAATIVIGKAPEAFAATSPPSETVSTLPTLLEKMNGLFDDETTVTSPTTSSYALTPSDRPNALSTEIDSLITTTSSLACVCFDCWKRDGARKDTANTGFVEEEEQETVEAVPSNTSTTLLMVPTACSPTSSCSSGSASPSRRNRTLSSSCSTTSPAPQCFCSICQDVPTVSMTPTSSISESRDSESSGASEEDRRLLYLEVQLLRQKVSLQEEIIQRMMELQRVSDQLAGLRIAEEDENA